MKEKQEDKQKRKMKMAINQLGENYTNIERSLVEQLKMMTPKHPLTTGTYREEVWKSMFEMIIPKKYCIDQGVFIIDSYGHISNEVDLVIFDEMYTPYIFKYKKIKFIPVEAVAIVVECKSKIFETTKNNLDAWLESINLLTTSLNSVARILSGLKDNSIEEDKRKSQTGTRPIKILCTTEIKESDKDFLLDKNGKFDLILSINKDRLKLDISGEKDLLEVWNESLNHYKSPVKIKEEETAVKKGEHQNTDKAIIEEKKQPELEKSSCEEEKQLDDKDIRNIENLKVRDICGNENVIMSLTFQLNQLLMVINNPMLFPHKSYADMFNRVFKDKNN